MFEKEYHYCIIGGILSLIAAILYFPCCVPIIIWTWWACKDYHNKRINALLKWGPENTLGMFYQSTHDYQIWLQFLRDNLKD